MPKNRDETVDLLFVACDETQAHELICVILKLLSDHQNGACAFALAYAVAGMARRWPWGKDKFLEVFRDTAKRLADDDDPEFWPSPDGEGRGIDDRTAGNRHDRERGDLMSGGYFGFTTSDVPTATATEPTTEFDRLHIDFETDDAEAATIIVTSNRLMDTWEREEAALRMNKEQVGHLLAYLALIHPMMAVEKEREAK